MAALHLGFSLGKFDLLAYFVTPALFLGPLYGLYLSGNLPFVAHWTFNHRKNTLDWVGIRNYIVVSATPPNLYEFSNHIFVFKQAPISEELVWRSCIITAYRLAGASNAFLVFFTPLSFGSGALLLYHRDWHQFNPILAHLHHVWEIYNMHGRTRQALQRAIVLTRK